MENHTDGAGNRISIHALLAESDRRAHVAAEARSQFLSTLSLRRATTAISAPKKSQKFLSTLSLRRATADNAAREEEHSSISIHALLAESDRPKLSGIARHTYFYPRSPCGERLWVLRKVPILSIFLSTLSLRRATVPFRILRM